jgi:BMFP domain-containing protein YqiC
VAAGFNDRPRRRFRIFPTMRTASSRFRPPALRRTLAPTPENTMIDLNHIDDLARRLSDLVPPGLRESGEELQASFRTALQAGLAKLDLVTREEFDVQRAVLLRSREKLETLERAVEELEARLHAAGQPPAGPPASPH